MASQRVDHRGQMLRINVPPNMAQQQGGQPLFSPALPTALQTQFRPSISHGLPHPLNLSNMNPMQTPIQSQFFPQAVPFIPGHQQRGSIVGPHSMAPQFALQGPNPGVAIPLTPGFNVGFQQHQMPPHIANGQPPPGQGGHGRSGSVSMPFNRNRRQNSISLGGPPKATLGGPMNKHTAAPMTNPASSAAVLEKTLKGKKLTVKVPKECPTEDGSVPEFARVPVPPSELPHFEEPPALDTATAALFPDERPKGEMPKTIDVFLPGKAAWETLKRAMMEEKLMKLGVERTGVPPIFAHGVHGRAASISSPADPGLLMFKLNKLHQHQAQATSPSVTGSGRLSVSPGPRMQNHSPSPNHLLGPWFNSVGGNHRHSMSLANPSYSPQASFNPNNNGYNSIGAFNPFGPSATLGSDQIISPSMSAGSGRGRLPNEEANSDDGHIHAPRGVPGRLASGLGKPDFIRGFGLDITEETEEELEQEEPYEMASDIATSEVAAALQEDLDAIPEADETPSRSGSRRHSRHTSRVSAALSLRSLGRGGKSDSGILEEEEDGDNYANEAIRAWGSEGAARSMGDDDGADAANEWTASDDESLGEYSNPSDEERAREQRESRRRAKIQREKVKADVSRQLQAHSNNNLTVPRTGRGHEQDSDDIVSNPSEEERVFNRRPSTSRPLPALPTSASHSRVGSGQFYSHSRSGSGQPLPHAVPLPHSRAPSGQLHNGSYQTTPPLTSPGAGAPSSGSHGFAINHRDSLNPNAKPFVFGKAWYSSTSMNPPPPSGAALPIPPPLSAGISRLSVAAPEFKPSFNVPEFKPSVAAKEFKPSPGAPEFKSTAASSDLKPKLPSMEFNPSGLTGAFRSNPGSGDFTPRIGDQSAAISSDKATGGTSDFTFRPPPVAPQLSFPEPALLAEPAQPVNAFGRAIQGREKRVRKDSNPDVDLGTETQGVDRVFGQELTANPREDTEEPTPFGADSFTWNSLTSYKFPHEEEAPAQEPVARGGGHKSPNRTFTFPPNKKSVTAIPAPVVAPMVESPNAIPTTVSVPQPAVQHTQSADSIGRARSPRPPPLNELPKRGSAVAEMQMSSSPSSRPNSARALPQPPQRSQTLFNDFKPHPVSSNTVPASLFKNLSISNAPPGDVDPEDDDENPLSVVAARLVSNERLEHSHRHSLDDIHMPMIARKITRGPENREFSPKDTLAPTPETSAPKAMLSVPEVPPTPGLHTPRSYTRETQLSTDVTDDKMDLLRSDVRNMVESYLLKVNSATSTRAEEALMRIARLMRDQAAERHSQDATASRSPVDPEAIRTIVEESTKEVCTTMQRDLANFSQHVQAGVQRHPGEDILRTVEEQASRIITAVSGATMNLAARLEAVHLLVDLPATVNSSEAVSSHPAGHARVPSHDDLLKVLRPHLEALRSAPFDVDVVTARLADAVKPTLADFIDLASDKGETADLIVAKLRPVFAALRPSQLDTQEIATQLAADVSRLVPPVDSHALTEQVADLVVERLDSRLSVREKALKPEFLVQKVTEALQPLMSSGSMSDVLQRLSQQDEHFKSQGAQMQALEGVILRSIQAIPDRIQPTTDVVADSVDSRAIPHDHSTTARLDSQYLLAEIQRMLQQHSSQHSVPADGLANGVRSHLEPIISSLSSKQDSIIANQSTLVELTQQSQNMLDTGLGDALHTQDSIVSQLQDLSASSNKIIGQTSILPDRISAMEESLTSAQAEFLSKLRSLPDVIDLQNQRMELQVQLTKARTSHGQVRSEKDVLGERAHALESERDRLRSELQSLKSSLAEKDSEVATAVSKAEQADKALQQALSRVEVSEAVAKTLREQVLRMENTQRESQRASNERQAKVDSLELQLKFATQDKESAQESLRRVEQERDSVVEQQQDSWRESKINSQKIDSLLQLLTTKESDELRELKRQRDRARGTEAELSSAKKCVAELESKMETLIRSEAKSTQALEDSQRQAEEFETRLGKLQRELEPLRRLDEAQKTRDRDFEEIRAQLQMQEKQEDLLRQNNATLQDELATLRNELELSRKAQATAKWQQHQAKEPVTPPYARAAPGINGRSHVQRAGSSRSSTPPATNGVWASKHAPSKNGKTPPGYQSVTRSAVAANGHPMHSTYGRAASPAQSVVSQAPTLREDGWWA